MKRILVTGGHGFLGSHVVDRLCTKGYQDICVPRSHDFDLRKRDEVNRLLRCTQPDVIIHLAANVGGIGFNQQQPGRLFYENIIMGAEMIDAAKDENIGKFVLVSSTCAYPKNPPVPFKEEDLWNGFPEETNAGYGIAKKAVMLQGQLYRQQYGLNVICVVPTNLYGERDNFDPGSSHVIPALIKKCVEAKRNGADHIEMWGDGSATRDFLYVGDCATAVVDAMEQYNGADPINLGSGAEVAMHDLVNTIKEATGFEGSIVYDTSRPNGQPRRVLDVSKAISAFGFRAKTPLEEGIKKTVEWYVKTTDINQQL